MLEYVGKRFQEDEKKDAQRRFVDLLRQDDRSSVSARGRYVRLNGMHHIAEAHDEVWARGKQAIAWLEDHVNGVQDMIAVSTASLLPAEDLAKEAEAAGMWWQASLRWNALAQLKMSTSGLILSGSKYLKNAVRASANVVATTAAGDDDSSSSSPSQVELDLFELFALKSICTEWDPAVVAIYGQYPPPRSSTSVRSGRQHATS